MTTSPAARQALWSRAVTTAPFDAETPWSELAKYVVKRLFRYHGAFASVVSRLLEAEYGKLNAAQLEIGRHTARLSRISLACKNARCQHQNWRE